MDNKMNVLHIYQNSQVGGIQQQILGILGAYDRSVVNPMFCCLGPKKEIAREIEALEIPCFALNRKEYNKFSPGIILDLYRLMRTHHIHVLRTHKYRANLYGRPAARLARVPVVIASEHNIYRDREKRLRRKLLNKFLSGITDKVVAVSEAIKSDIARYDKVNQSKLLIIRNGVNIDKFTAKGAFANVRKELGIRDETTLIGFIGRLVQNKGLEYLLEAFSRVKKECVDSTVMIVGYGSLMEELKKSAQRKGIGNDVLFTGQRRDIPAVLSAIDIFAMSSVKEGLPNALLEALAMGKPVVATAVGGIPEIVENGVTGLVVRPADPGALEEAILRLINDKSLANRLGAEAQDFIIQNHSIETTVQKWQSLYQSILQEKGISP